MVKSETSHRLVLIPNSTIPARNDHLDTQGTAHLSRLEYAFGAIRKLHPLGAQSKAFNDLRPREAIAVFVREIFYSGQGCGSNRAIRIFGVRPKIYQGGRLLLVR